MVVLWNQTYLGHNPESATHWFTEHIINNLNNKVASTYLLRLLHRFNKTMPIKHLATPYQELHVFQALCCHPQPDFTGGKWRDSKHLLGNFGLMTNSAMVPIPRRLFRDNHLFFFLGHCIQPSWVSLLDTNSHHNNEEPRKTSGSLAAQGGESPSPETHSAVRGPGNSPFPLQCFVGVTAWPDLKLLAFVHFSWWRLYLKQHRAPARSRRAVRTQQENKSLLYGHEILTKEVLLCLGMEEKGKRKYHPFRGIYSIFAACLTPTWSDRIRTLLI